MLKTAVVAIYIYCFARDQSVYIASLKRSRWVFSCMLFIFSVSVSVPMEHDFLVLLVSGKFLV